MRYAHLAFLACWAALACERAKPPEQPDERQQALVPAGFQAFVVDDQIAAPWGKSVCDIDGDGQLDLLAQGNITGGLRWYKAPTWALQPRPSQATGFGTDLECADVDGDGDADIVSVRNSHDGSEGAGLWLYTQEPNEQWTISEIADEALHDVEAGDGWLATRDQSAFTSPDSGALVHFYELGTWAHTTVAVPQGEGLKVVDLDGDGDRDVLVNQVWLEQTGSGWVSHTWTTTYTHEHTYLATGDIDGDGRLDIVATPAEKNTLYRASWFRAPADRTELWEEHVLEDGLETTVHSAAVADFNGDGPLDVCTASMHQSASPNVSCYYQESDGSWCKQVVSTVGSHSMRVVSGANGPGLFGANWGGGADEVRLWVNQGGGGECSPVGQGGTGGTGGEGEGQGGCASLLSDEFDGSDLDDWLFVDPRADSSAQEAGGEAQITVGAGALHDLWKTDKNAPRLLRAVSADFDIAVKFASQPDANGEGQGVIVGVSATQFYRCDVRFDGGTTKWFSAWVSGGSATVLLNSGGVFQPFIRVRRTGDEYECYRSSDGETWTEIADDARSLTVSDVGLYAINFGTSPPTHTVAADWFRDLTDPGCGGAGGEGGSGGTGGAPNEAPTAAFETASASVALDGSLSFDNDGSIVSWAWDCGNSTTAEGVEATCVYSAPGSYVVTLTVTDSGGAQASVQHPVELP